MRPQNGRARLVRGIVGRPSAGAACPKSARSGPVAAGWPAARPAPPDPPPGSARTSTATIRPTQTRTRSRASWSWSRRSAGPRCPEGGDGGLGDRLVPVAPGRQQCGGGGKSVQQFQGNAAAADQESKRAPPSLPWRLCGGCGRWPRVGHGRDRAFSRAWRNQASSGSPRRLWRPLYSRQPHTYSLFHSAPARCRGR
jgi:hypothetical protein